MLSSFKYTIMKEKVRNSEVNADTIPGMFTLCSLTIRTMISAVQIKIIARSTANNP